MSIHFMMNFKIVYSIKYYTIVKKLIEFSRAKDITFTMIQKAANPHIWEAQHY